MSDDIPLVKQKRWRTFNIFVLECFNGAMRETILHNQWVPAELLTQFINEKFMVPSELQFDKTTLIRNVGKFYPNCTSFAFPTELESNVKGQNIYVFRYELSFKDRAMRRLTAFYASAKKGFLPPVPHQSRNTQAWLDEHVMKELIPIPNYNTYPVMPSFVVDAINESAGVEPVTKRQKVTAAKLSTRTSPATNSIENTAVAVVPAVTLPPCPKWTYWDSGDARKLFAPKSQYKDDVDVKEVVVDRIALLESVNQKPQNWRFVVEGGDANNTYSERDIFHIRHRSAYLALALQKFLTEAETSKRWTWKDCLQYACDTMSGIGIKVYANTHTLQIWHRQLANSSSNTFGKSLDLKRKEPPVSPVSLDSQENPDVANVSPCPLPNANENAESSGWC